MKPQLNIPPSLLESYRMFRDGEYNFTITQEKLIDQICGKKRLDPRARSLGNCYHKYLELGHGAGSEILIKPPDIWGIRVHDKKNDLYQEFTTEELLPAAEFRRDNPNTIYETRTLPMNYIINGFPVRVSGRMDAITGFTIDEFKTTTYTRRAPDLEKFRRSVQAKCYLAACPDMQRVRHTVFQLFRGNDPAKRRGLAYSTVVERTGREDVEILTLLGMFVALLERHELIDFVTYKPKTDNDNRTNKNPAGT